MTMPRPNMRLTGSTVPSHGSCDLIKKHHENNINTLKKQAHQLMIMNFMLVFQIKYTPIM